MHLFLFRCGLGISPLILEFPIIFIYHLAEAEKNTKRFLFQTNVSKQNPPSSFFFFFFFAVGHVVSPFNVPE